MKKRPLKTRILFVLPTLSAGGAERSVVNLVRGLAADFDTPFAVGKDVGRLRAELPSHLEIHRLGGAPTSMLRLLLLVWRLRPDIVFSTIFDLNIALLLLRVMFPRKTKVVVREAAMPIVSMHEARWPNMWRTLYRLSYPTADAVVVLSESMRNKLLKSTRVSLGKIHIIENAVSASRLPASSMSVERYDEDITMVATGRLEREKGYDLMCAAIKLAIVQIPTLRLTIFGEGSLRSELEKTIEHLQLGAHIRLAGHVQNPLPEMAQADFFISCSRYEGMSNAMLEALCCGVPVIATVGENSVTDIIIDGTNGVLIQGYGVEDIAKGIRAAVVRKGTFNRAAIRSAALDRHDGPKQLRRYARLFYELQSSTEGVYNG